MRTLFALILACGILTAGAQSPALQEMVAAERAFIEMARTQNRRDAFLFFLTDSAVTLGPNGPRKGKAHIASQPVSGDLLSWEITFSDIAASGDMGYNTGPWEFRAKKTDEKSSAFGEFNSVWKKQTDGTWKNVLDIGITHGPQEGPFIWSSRTQDRLVHCVQYPHTPASDAEQKFLEQLSKGIRVTYLNSLSSNARMMVTGQLPFKGVDQLTDFLAACPEPSQYTILGGETSSSMDLGYVYGTVMVRIAKDGTAANKKATYIRVWRIEDCKWKIVLDVLSF